MTISIANGYKTFVGIDYSMSSPAVTIALLRDTDTFSFHSCQFQYATTTKNKVGAHKGPTTGRVLINGTLIPSAFSNNASRWHWLAGWTMLSLQSYDPKDTIIYAEGYSMGSRAGQAFHIGENTGVLKDRLHSAGFDLQIVPPTRIKKFGSGSGKSKKPEMVAAFHSETGVNLIPLFTSKLVKNPPSPVSDLVDSFYICKYGWSQYIAQLT